MDLEKIDPAEKEKLERYYKEMKLELDISISISINNLLQRKAN